MANLIVEGFEWFPTGQNIATRTRLLSAENFAVISLGDSQVPDVATGRFGYGLALSWNVIGGPVGASTTGYAFPLGKTVNEAYFGCAFYRDPLTGIGVSPGIGFMDGPNNNCQVYVSFEPSGVVKVWKGFINDGFNTQEILLASSKSGTFIEGEWFHVEIHAKSAAIGGFVEVRINTVPVVQLVSANTDLTGSGTFDALYVGVSNNSFHGTAVFMVDDLFANDTTGSYNNTWGGNLRVKSQFVTANGATVNFTIGGSSPAATHWQSVLNALLDDTKYEYTSNVGDIDLFVPDPNLNSPLVRVVQVKMALRQDDATQRAAQAVLRISGTNYPSGVNSYTNQTFTFYNQRWETNPATGVTFTGAEVNGLQAGLKLAA